nr:ORF7a protein [Severe acute respiratory syndrome coronavirus 2]
MKIILFLALITLATCELYHYQECVRGTTVLLKEPCSSGTYEGNSPFQIFLIVAAIVFITLCFTLKRKTE